MPRHIRKRVLGKINSILGREKLSLKKLPPEQRRVAETFLSSAKKGKMPKKRAKYYKANNFSYSTALLVEMKILSTKYPSLDKKTLRVNAEQRLASHYKKSRFNPERYK